MSECEHILYNWNLVYQCRECGEIVPEEIAQPRDIEHASLTEENAALKRITSEFGGYRVVELLKIIALDYRMPKAAAAKIVRDARSNWLIDFANALPKEQE